jgi:hypothetical protein
MKIPLIPERHNEKSGVYNFSKSPIYKHKTGKINMRYWARYNNVEYLFGIPHKTNQYFKQEKAFFEIRIIGRVINNWFYFDKSELNDIQQGFTKIKEYWDNK